MIQNITKKTRIAEKAQICSGIWCKTIGLMFSSTPKTIIFTFNKEQQQYLHMFFVFFPIDLIFLDKNKKVIEIKENFRPFTIYNSSKKAMYVIECGDGTVKKTRTTIGDKIKF